MRSGENCRMVMLLANRFRCSRGLRFLPGSTRVSRVGFGVSPKQSFKVRDGETPSPDTRDARATRTGEMELLCALFVCRRLPLQIRQDFTGEMERASNQNWVET